MFIAKKNVFKFNKPVPIVLGSFINGLGLVRSFGEMAIPSICLDYTRNIAMYSKYSKNFICPHPLKKEVDFIKYLLQLGSRLKNKGILFATGDDWLMSISKNQKILSQYYSFPMSGWDTIKKIINKSYLYKIADQINIPIPRTFFLDSLKQIKNIKKKIIFPCILKPAITINFAEKLKIGNQVLIIENSEKLDNWAIKIKNAHLDNIKLIIQEQIYGPIKNLYTLTAYSDRKGEIKAYSIGHKIRQFPPEAGTIMSGRLKNQKQILNLGIKLIKKLNFCGLSNTEFKKDEKDGKFKLMEINPRSGKWTYSATAAGLNLPYIAYQETLGVKSISKNRKHTNNELVWLDLLNDLLIALFGYKIRGFCKARISFKEWKKSIKGKKRFAVISVKDPVPMFIHIYLTFKQMLIFLNKKGKHL